MLRTIEKKNPLKQGLKLPPGKPEYMSAKIEKKNPLKQGLKHNVIAEVRPARLIEKKNPLKQGLKPYINPGYLFRVKN